MIALMPPNLEEFELFRMRKWAFERVTSEVSPPELGLFEVRK